MPLSSGHGQAVGRPLLAEEKEGRLFLPARAMRGQGGLIRRGAYRFMFFSNCSMAYMSDIVAIFASSSLRASNPEILFSR